jgi:hypothetical protein
MEAEKMKLLAFAKLLNRKINTMDKKAVNPFLDYNDSLNPFCRPMYNTLVWVESDKNENNERKNF